MNYGDGWYGGVFVGAMYTLAFVSDSIAHIVNEALKTIPSESKFHQCIADVIRWHRAYPTDWHNTWFELQKKWSSDIGCPDGVFDAFDIDAKLNAAYVVMALLYGNGDYTRTLDIAARSGQDADCNPSTAGGVLGAMLGYSKIPAYWKMGLKEAESIDFKYTKMSLAKVYEIGFAQALENIRRNGGKVEDANVRIRLQEPARVRLEQSFPGMYPVLKRGWAIRDVKDSSLNFEGTGFVLRGEAAKKKEGVGDYVFNMEVSVDGQPADTIRLPTLFTTRRHDLCWKYLLPKGPHTVRIRVLNLSDDFGVNTQDYIVYSDHPIEKK
jgi:ADP-ribosylglycohydrolase